MDIPCPYCGSLNESEREVCWACFKLLKPGASAGQAAPGVYTVTRTISAKISVDGRDYERLEDVPEPLRSQLRQGVAGSLLEEASLERSGVKEYRLGPFVIRSHGRYVSEPVIPEPGVRVARPEGFEVVDEGAERRVSWRWFTWSAFAGLFFVAVFGVPFGFVFFIYERSPAHSWPASGLVMLALLGAAPAGLAYTWLAYLVNRTTLRMDAARLQIRHGPLPWPGAKDVLRSEIVRVFSERRTHNTTFSSDGTAFEPKVTYEVKALLKDGRALKLAAGLLAVQQAFFIQQQAGRP